MNSKHLLSLLESDSVTIHVKFGTCFMDGFAAQFNGQDKSYTYKAPKSLELKVGDIVTVNSPSRGVVTCYVDKVDETADIDVNATFNYEWIIGKVDVEPYKDRKERERQFAALMLEIERKRQRENLLADFKQHLPEGSEARNLFDKVVGSFIEGGALPHVAS